MQPRRPQLACVYWPSTTSTRPSLRARPPPSTSPPSPVPASPLLALPHGSARAAPPTRRPRHLMDACATSWEAEFQALEELSNKYDNQLGALDAGVHEVPRRHGAPLRVDQRRRQGCRPGHLAHARGYTHSAR